MRKDRRQAPRNLVSWPGRYKFDGQSSWGWCLVTDVSLRGAGVELRGIVPRDCVGSRVMVDLESSLDLRLVGECRYVNRGIGGGPTWIGIEFDLVAMPELRLHVPAESETAGAGQ